MTPDQRMNYEMMMAKNATIIEMMKEEKRQMAKEVVEEVTKEVTAEVTAEVTKVARETAIEVAKKMKTKGISNSDIHEITGLSIKEVENL